MTHFIRIFNRSVATITFLATLSFAQMLESAEDDAFKSIDDISTPEYLKKEVVKQDSAEVKEPVPASKEKTTTTKSSDPSKEMVSKVTVGTYIEFGNDAGGLHATYRIDPKMRVDLYMSSDFESIMFNGGLAMMHEDAIKSGNIRGDLYWGPYLGTGIYKEGFLLRVGLFGGVGVRLVDMPKYGFFINLEPSSSVFINRSGNSFDMTTHALKFGMRYSL